MSTANANDVTSEETAPLISIETDVTLDSYDYVEGSPPVGPVKTANVSREDDTMAENHQIITSHPTEADLVKACEKMSLDKETTDAPQEDSPINYLCPTKEELIQAWLDRYC
jgi:hypothetical protein